MSEFDYINKTYGVNACIGRRVIVYGEPGTIIKDCGNHLGVNFDNRKPGHVSRCHPTSEVQYLDEFRAPRKMTAGQRRYQEYLDADSGQSFSEWIGAYRKLKPTENYSCVMEPVEKTTLKSEEVEVSIGKIGVIVNFSAPTT